LIEGVKMSGKKISRNDPCPCGSGKKFKNCCVGKGIDWDARRSAPRPLPPPRPTRRTETGFPAGLSLTPFGVVDARLREIASATPGPATWKDMAGRLSEKTPLGERLAAYRAIQGAGVLPDDAAFFLFGHAIQWLPHEGPPGGDEDDEAAFEALDRHTLDTLRRHGLSEMADLFAISRLEYDRRHERGRQFFYGPPDEELAKRLREKGIIE
jgi:hypothetical protein